MLGSDYFDLTRKEEDEEVTEHIGEPKDTSTQQLEDVAGPEPATVRAGCQGGGGDDEQERRREGWRTFLQS